MQQIIKTRVTITELALYIMQQINNTRVTITIEYFENNSEKTFIDVRGSFSYNTCKVTQP